MTDLSLDNPEKWSSDRRIKFVSRLFGRIAPHYDLLNHLLSGGQDYYWRRRVAGRIPQHAEYILDAACGTGDLALLIHKKIPRAEIIALDFTSEMVAAARNKTKHNTTGKLLLVPGDVLKLPFIDQVFDAVTIAFAMRNIPDRLLALQEMARVVKPGGKLLILEMTFPRSLRLRIFFYWYLNWVIPFLGGLISRDREAYKYLSASIQSFLSPEAMCELMRSAGLQSTKAFSLSGGICWLFEGIKE
ncbi:MAG: bifunctional demethylmenaquinone methyltransferase/2-methoxy-6-polyprenyl-1,4-benzoquinol methylase UbiE [Calditrichota bacterium]